MIDFNNKVLLITGGTGSFGNAVLRKFLRSDIAEIRILSRDEKKQDDMRKRLNDDRIKFYLGDVRDYDSVYQCMMGVDHVFHAAALKQVPSCEFYPMQAIKTNTLGAENVLQAAFANKVNRVIVLSTDKAVYPINVMGMSKAMMEKLMIAKSRLLNKEQQVFCATRYGNVMGSRGSVIPLFMEQIGSGEPLTITDPNMTRFMMSLEQSVELVEFAFGHGAPGDIFVQKAPAATIGMLAEVIRDIFNASSDIRVIGTRHGEKLYEALLTREEMAKAIDLGDFYRIPADGRDLNYSNYMERGEARSDDLQDYNSHNTNRLDYNELKELLLNQSFVQEQLK